MPTTVIEWVGAYVMGADSCVWSLCFLCSHQKFMSNYHSILSPKPLRKSDRSQPKGRQHTCTCKLYTAAELNTYGNTCCCTIPVLNHCITCALAHCTKSPFDPWKLWGVLIAINYTSLSMAYHAYDSTVNLRAYCAYNYYYVTVYQKNSTVKRS